MQLKQSEYLLNCKPQLKKLIALLSNDYAYASVLASDVGGKQYAYSQKRKSVSPFGFSERGFVVRVYGDKGYQEYSFNELGDIEKTAEKIRKALNSQQSLLDELKVEKVETPLAYEEEMEKAFAGEIGDDVSEISDQQIMAKLKAMSDEAVSNEYIFESNVRFSKTGICKMFISQKKELIQAYGYTLCAQVAIAFKDGKTNYNYYSASGHGYEEVVNDVESHQKQLIEDTLCLFDAGNIAPGEYTVICPPDAAGLIAHEAFGHGLEMDMFVKERAVAKYHMNEQIASDITDMYDGTTEINDTASYFFDDEGTIGGLTHILDKGVLKNGMSDLLSAARLHVKPSGNGRRESFERKAYTRMTNTYFGTGNSTLDEMIASIDYGFLIDGGQSGMEDPKHWGIQCVLSRAKEIRDGKLTGKVFTPVILTGYVPDLLKDISMVGKDIKTNGNGMCGKGHKEWVVVSDGGPYIKTKVRLG